MDSSSSGPVTPVWARSVVGGGLTAGVVHVASMFSQQIMNMNSIVVPTLIVAAIVALCSLVADLDRRAPRGILALGSAVCIGAGILIVYSLNSMMAERRFGSAMGGLDSLGGSWTPILLLGAIAMIGVIRSGRDQSQRLAGGVVMALMATGSMSVAAYLVYVTIASSITSSSLGSMPSFQALADAYAALLGGFFTLSLVVVQAGVLGKRPEDAD